MNPAKAVGPLSFGAPKDPKLSIERPKEDFWFYFPFFLRFYLRVMV
jgi:hypothetical protein